MKYRLVIAVLIGLPVIIHAQQVNQSQQVNQFEPGEKEKYTNIVNAGLQTGESPAVKQAIERLENSFKGLVTTYMQLWASQLSQEQKIILYPILTDVQALVALYLQDPDLQKVENQNKEMALERKIATALLPFRIAAPESMERTSSDEKHLRNGIKALNEALESVIEFFKPNQTITLPGLKPKPADSEPKPGS